MQVAGLQDFRGEGPPGDIGVFQAAVSVIVYQFTFSGVTYIVAQRIGVRGWILVCPPNIDATTVINAALNGLTAGRTWKEKVVVKGNFSLSDTVKFPSYTILEIQGKLTLANNINKNMIEVQDPAAGNEQIMILGGVLDGNKANQATGKGIYITGPANYHGSIEPDVFIKDITIQNTKEQGIYTAVRYTIIEDVFIDNCDVGGVLTNSNDNFLIRVHVHNAIMDSYGFKIAGSFNELYMCSAGVCGKQIADNNDGFIIGTTGGKNTLYGCISEYNARHGIIIYGTNDNRIIDCKVLGNSRITTDNGDGIMIYDGQNNIVAFNKVYDPEVAPNKTQRYGINEVGTSDYNTIAFNTVTENSVGSISHVGVHTRLENNVGYTTEGNPLWLPAYWTSMSLISANTNGVANRVWITPVYFPNAMTISRVSIQLSTGGGAGTFLRIGLYADNGGTPDGGALLADSGNIAADAGATAYSFTLPTPLSFGRGIKAWVALETADTVIVFIRTAASWGFLDIGSEKMGSCRYALGGFGAFTNPCPATTIDTTARVMAFLRVDSIDE